MPEDRDDRDARDRDREAAPSARVSGPYDCSLQCFDVYSFQLSYKVSRDFQSCSSCVVSFLLTFHISFLLV